MPMVLLVMAAVAALGFAAAGALAAYAQRHWRRGPDGPPDGGTRDRYGLAA